MTKIEQIIVAEWLKLREEGATPEEAGNAIINWATGNDLPGNHARVSGPTAKQIDAVLAALIREDTNPEYARLVAKKEDLPLYLLK